MAAGARGPPSGAADHPRLRRAAVHRLRRDPRRPPLRRRSRHRRRAGAVPRPAGDGRGAPEGQRHQAEDLPQLRLRASRGLPQGAAGDAAGREVRPADRLLRRHAGGLSRHRVGGARRRRGHRRQPARDGRARRADHRRRARRGRQRRRPRHRGRRPHPDARVRRLQRDSARRLRGAAVARHQPARSSAAEALKITAPDLLGPRHHRRDREGAGRRRPHRPGRRGAVARRRARRALADGSAPSAPTSASSGATRSSARWAASASSRPSDRWPHRWSGNRAPATRRRDSGSNASSGLSPVVARLLAIRGHHDPEAADRFLRPSLSHLRRSVADDRPGAGGGPAAGRHRAQANASSCTATTTSMA